MEKARVDAASRVWGLGAGWRFLRIGGEGYLVGEADLVRVRGEVASELLSALAESSGIRSMEAKHGRGEVERELARMAEAGFAISCEAGREEEERFWQRQGISRELAAERLGQGVELMLEDPGREKRWIEALEEVGIPVLQGADVALYDALDYGSEGVLRWNAEQIRERKPWLLCRAGGSDCWVGPWIIPGKTACAACLAKRLRENRWVEGIPRKLGLRLSPAVNYSHPMLEGFAMRAAVATLVRNLVFEEFLGAGQLEVWAPQEGRIQRHRVDRLRECEACRGLGIPDPEVKWRPNFSEVSGFLRNSMEVTPLRDWPVRLWGVQFTAPEGAGGAHEAISPQWATGRGRRISTARRKSVFEALERRASYWHGDEATIEASAAELGELAVDVESTLLYSEAQYEQRREIAKFSQESRLDWRAAFDWGRKRLLHVPAAICHMGYPKRADWTEGASSNGCAAGASYADAALRGTLELLERDAASIWWYGRVARPRLDVGEIRRPWTRQMLVYLKSKGLEVRVYDLTHDWEVPVYAAVVEAGGEVYLGLGCDVSGEAAVSSSVSELYQSLFARSRQETGERLETGWMDASSHSVGLRRGKKCSDSGAAMEALVERGKALGVGLWFLELSRKDYGCPVVRAIGPGLRPSEARYGKGRLYEVPMKLGWVNNEVRESELNRASLPL